MSSEHRSGSLADVLDVILDKGLVIDAFVRVSLVGIEILTIDARIVVASVDTYMHFAREAHRLEMGGGQGSAKQGLAGAMGKMAEGGAHSIGRGALQGAGEGLKEGLLPHPQKSEARGGVVQRAVGAIRNAISPDDQEEPDHQEEQNQEARAPGPESRQSAPE
ncbi:MAG: gas vesicle protein, partial [Candidatus Dormibacteraeota bacterium]|nr:gas vesicle protein [Candidatus Dormibacteraeota bacterium]